MTSDRFRQRLALFWSCAAAVALVMALPARAAEQAPQKQTPAPQTPARSAKAPESAKASDKSALPTARALIDRHIKAIGGRQAVLSHSSSRATGTFTVTGQGLKGTLDVIAAKPNRNMVKINLPGLGEIVEGHDGQHAWTNSPMTGPMLLEGRQLEDKRFDADYYSELHDDGRYQSMTTVERVDFEGRPCYKVRLVRKNGSEDFEFYDADTGLKAGRVATRETPMGTMTGTTVETDYKKFGNLLLPTTIKNTIMGVQQIITIDTVEYDNVPASAFEPPAEIKALIK
jgi:hypothetical protein